MATPDSRTYATGKRKTAIARIWLKAGTGSITVNGKPCDDYFERETSRMILRQAFELLEAQDQFGLQIVLFRIGQPELQPDIACRVLGRRNPRHRSFSLSSIKSRSRFSISLRSGFGVLTPVFDFFWKA